MNLNVLLSCMHQKDFSIIEKSNLSLVDTIIVNQCDVAEEEKVVQNTHLMVKSPTRGLSVSRNLAIKNSDADICLLSDDDEIFNNDLNEIITAAYDKIPDADIIIFKMKNYPTRFPDEIKKLKKYDCLKVSSFQISFRLSKIKNNIFFDSKLGAGTGNGASEECKFLLDCYESGLKIYYVPIEIGTINIVSSTWFSGYDKKYFFNRGKTTRYILGLPISILYAFHFLLLKRKLYKKNISVWQAGKFLFKGILAKDIDVKYE